MAPLPTPIIESTPVITDAPKTLFQRVLGVFSDKVPEIRARKNSADPQRVSWINPALNENRINFLIFGNGETLEPPVIVKPGIRIGSFSVYSFKINPQNGNVSVDVVSISHDFDSIPVAIATYGTQKAINPNTRLSRTQDVGGLPLMAKEVEQATGFDIDFSASVEDTEIAYAIDYLLRGVDITPQTTVTTFPFFMDGKEQPGLSFTKDKTVHLNGSQAIGTIKAVPVEDSRGYLPGAEHHVREGWLMDATIVKTFQNLVTDPGFLGRFQIYTQEKIKGNGRMKLDFGPELMQGAMDRLTQDAPGFALHPWDIGMPTGIRSRMYVADQRSSSVSGPITPCFGVRYGGDMFVPVGADPLTQTSLEYWKPLRKCVGDSLEKLK